MKKRKINKAKRVDSSCKNHGSCPYCRNSRTFSNKKREPIEEKYYTPTIKLDIDKL